MALWFTNEQWQDYVRREEDLQKGLLANSCEHIVAAVKRGDIYLNIWPSNCNASHEDVAASDWLINNSEPSYDSPISNCPWCGVELPDIPRLYI